jgi:hypothetical protein
LGWSTWDKFTVAKFQSRGMLVINWEHMVT